MTIFLPRCFLGAFFIFVRLQALCAFLWWWNLLIKKIKKLINCPNDLICITTCLALYYYAKVIVELEKTQTRNSGVLWPFIMGPSITLKFQFIFCFNECLCLRKIFSLQSFEHFWFYVWVVLVITFDFTT